MIRWLAVLAAASMVACGGSSDEPLSVGTGPLAGRIGGQAWTYVQGDTDPFLSSSTEPDLYARLYGETYAACGFPPGVIRLILPTLPKQPGDYSFSFRGRTGTFHVPPADHYIATRGRLIVEEVTETTVTARVHMIFDAQNEVDGEFVASICP